MKRALHIRTLHRSVVVITHLRVLMTVAFVQLANRRAIGLGEAVDWITIERIRDGHSLADHALQMQRSDVVVVIIRTTAVTTPLVELADLIRNLAAIVLRIEDRNAIHADGDRAAQEVVLHDLRRLCDDRLQRQPPRIVAKVWLRQRHLLLPGRDAHHHVMRGQAVRFDVKEVVVPLHIHHRREGHKGRGHGRCLADIRCTADRRELRCRALFFAVILLPVGQDVGSQ